MHRLYSAPSILKCKYRHPGLTQHLKYANSNSTKQNFVQSAPRNVRHMILLSN